MSTNLRVLILFILLGAGALAAGYQELRLGKKAQKIASALELSDLEGGAAVSNYHVDIQKHWALYPYLIYVYEKGFLDNDEPGDDTKIKYAYYPIISQQHPFNQALDRLYDQYGADIPEDQVPAFNSFRVLVKTTRFKTLGAVPADWSLESNISGVFVNEIHKLDKDEKALLQENWPQLNIDDVLILEEGRKPSSSAAIIVYWAIGILLILFGIRRYRKKQEKLQQEPPSQA